MPGHGVFLYMRKEGQDRDKDGTGTAYTQAVPACGMVCVLANQQHITAYIALLSSYFLTLLSPTSLTSPAILQACSAQLTSTVPTHKL